jgi:hypothetical protein
MNLSVGRCYQKTVILLPPSLSPLTSSRSILDRISILYGENVYRYRISSIRSRRLLSDRAILEIVIILRRYNIRIRLLRSYIRSNIRSNLSRRIFERMLRYSNLDSFIRIVSSISPYNIVVRIVDL